MNATANGTDTTDDDDPRTRPRSAWEEALDDAERNGYLACYSRDQLLENRYHATCWQEKRPHVIVSLAYAPGEVVATIDYRPVGRMTAELQRDLMRLFLAGGCGGSEVGPHQAWAVFRANRIVPIMSAIVAALKDYDPVPDGEPDEHADPAYLIPRSAGRRTVPLDT